VVPSDHGDLGQLASRAGWELTVKSRVLLTTGFVTTIAREVSLGAASLLQARKTGSLIFQWGGGNFLTIAETEDPTHRVSTMI